MKHNVVISVDELEMIKKSLDMYTHLQLGHIDRLLLPILDGVENKTTNDRKKRKIQFAKKLITSIRRIMKLVLHNNMPVYSIASPHVDDSISDAVFLYRKLNGLSDYTVKSKFELDIQDEIKKDV